MLQTEFKSQVDNLMNILFGAGVASHATIIEQINYLVFLRSLSKKDDSAIVLDPAAERIFNGQLSKFHWDNLLLLNADALFTTLEEIFRQLPELATDKTIKLLYRDAHVKVFDKPTLRRLLHEIEKMMAGLEKEAVSGQTDIFGDMYEYLLGKMSQAGTLGSFRTPRHIIKFMVDIIDPVKGETVLDPACGTAGFLVAALEHIKEKYTSEEYKKEGRYPMDLLKPGERDFVYKNTFTGFDSDFDMFKFGLMNLFLHKLEHPNIKRQNTLVDTAGDRTKWDVILANPPFAGALDVDSISEDIRMGTRATEILFLRYMIDHLSPNGRAGVIVPDGVVFANNTANKKIRKILVEDAGLWCVVSLPGGIFNPYAGVKTSILFFDKSLKGKLKEVLFVKIKNDGFDLGATKRKIDKNDLPESTELIQLYKNDLKQNLAIFLSKKKSKLQYAPIPISLISEDENYYLNSERYFNNHVQPKGVYKNSTIGELLNLDFGTRITKSKNTGTKYPVYGGGGESFRTDSFNRSDDYVISRFAMSANCVHYVPEKFFLLDSGLTLSIRDEYKNLISKEFLGKVLLSIQPVIYSCSRGNAQKNLEIDQFKKINIPLPPIEIQGKIVKEIVQYQTIIDGASLVIDNWKPLIKSDKPLKKAKLGEICIINPKKSEIKNLNKDTDVSFIPMADLSQNDMYFETKQIKKLSDVVGSYTYFGEHDVLLGRVTPCFENGKAGIAKNLKNKIGFGSSEYIVLRPKSDVLPEILYSFLISSDFKSEGKQKMTGTGGLQRVPVTFVENWEVELPTMEEQKIIVKTINTERETVNQLRQLIKTHKEKINQKIAEVWGGDGA